MYKNNSFYDSEEVQKIRESYIDRAVEFRRRIENKPDRVLKLYYDLIKPKGIWGWIKLVLSKDDQLLRYQATLDVLKKKSGLEKKL